MLQALSLENAPARGKVRSGADSDPAESAFAGLMAQASCPTRTPAATDPSPSREEREAAPERSDPRPEAPQASARTEQPASDTPPSDSSSDSSDKAKIAATPLPKEDAKSPGTPPGEASSQVPGTPPLLPFPTGAVPVPVQASGTPTAPPPQDLPALTPSVPTASAEIPSGDPEPSAAEPTVRADTTLKALPQQTQISEDPLPAPMKPALTELLYLPKGKIETPKLDPGSAKILQQGAPRLALADQTEAGGNSEPGADLPQSAVVQVKPVPIEEGNRLKQGVFTQAPLSQEHPAPARETAMVFLAEGVKAGQAATRVEAPVAARPTPVFAQVEGSIRWILQTKSQGAELQLHPESLGRMTIQLRVEGQDVHARLWASEPASLAVLQDHKTFLEASLREQGLNLASFDLQSGTRGHDAQTFQQEPAAAGVPLGLSVPEILQEMPTSTHLDSAEAHQIEIFA